MTSLRRASVAVLLSTVAIGCDGADDGAPGFAPYADMDQGVVARRVAAPPPGLASQKVGKVDVAPDGSIRLWRTGQEAEDDRFRHALERYAPDGRLEDRRDLGYEAEVVFHPDGQVTVAKPGADGAIEYARWSSSFRENAHVAVVRAGATVALPEFYRVADDGTFTVEPGGELVEPKIARFVAAPDGGFYGVQQFFDSLGHFTGVRLVRLDASHAIVAATWMLPGAELPIQWQGEPVVIDGEVVTPILRYMFGDVQLLVDHQHRVWALSSAPGSAAAALGRFFGRPVDLRDTGELFLLRFSASLELEAVVSVPAPNAQVFAMFAEGADGAIGVAALSTERRAIAPNKSFNYNVFFASIDRDGKLITARDHDLDRDDWPYTLVACRPGFCIAGETATTSVDTGSQVEFSQGFILAVGVDGSPVALSTLHGLRRNVIESLATRADGSVVFAGSTDGPITHTDPAEWSSIALLGILPL